MKFPPKYRGWKLEDYSYTDYSTGNRVYSIKATKDGDTLIYGSPYEEATVTEIKRQIRKHTAE